jgi:F0F1-type ATP synthase assembly protein I
MSDTKYNEPTKEVSIQGFRQPMVTATGIFLGFMLNFTSGWIKDAFTVYKFKDVVVAIAVGTCLSFLIIVLFRILRLKHPTEPEKFYRKTLFYFLIGITVPFIAFLIVIVDKMMKYLF